MRKILFVFLPFLFSILFLLVFYFLIIKNSGKGALQTTTEPKSQVFLNGKLIGQTPLCKCEGENMLNIGEYKLKLVPLEGGFLPYQETIKINKSVLTVVDRSFYSQASSEGSTITLHKLKDSKTLELLVLSIPVETEVILDGTKKGTTPLLLKDITASDHEIRLEKKGYKEKTIRIHTVTGYKLAATVYLSVDDSIPSIVLDNEETKDSTKSASKVAKVTILDTPTGFLRVRDQASLNGLEIAKVAPQESYDLIEEGDGWFKIKLKDGKEGWVSSQYSKKE